MVHSEANWKEYIMLCKMAKEICVEGNVAGEKTNHSLRATGVSNVFQVGVPEKLSQERSGHLSVDGLRQYQRTTTSQHQAVSTVFASDSSFGHYRSISAVCVTTSNCIHAANAEYFKLQCYYIQWSHSTAIG